MGDPRLVIARRELAVLRAEKTIVLALLIQLFIAAFSSFLVVGLVSLYDPGSVDGYQVEVAVSGDAREELLAVAADQRGVRAVEFRTEVGALDAFERSRVDAVLHADRRDGRVFVTATVPDSNIRTTVIVVQLRETLRAFERTERVERADELSRLPLALPPTSNSSPYYGFTYTVLVPLLCFLPVFISGSIAVDSITEEFERGTLELLRVAPVSLVSILDGKVWATTALAPAQAAIWLTLLDLNGTSVVNPIPVLVLVGALALAVVSLGVAVGVFAPDRRGAQFLYSMGVLGVFGATTLLPYSPTNTVARLAIGSGDATSSVVVTGAVVVAVVGYLGVRRTVPRFTG